MHLGFLLIIVILGLTGEIVLSLLEDDGIVRGNGDWFVRAGLLFVAAYSFFILRLLNERSSIRRVMKLRPQEGNLAVSNQLVVMQVIRSAQGPGIASAGIVASFLTSGRIELWVPIGLALALHTMVWPKGSHWESVFHEALNEYEVVSASPW